MSFGKFYAFRLSDLLSNSSEEICEDLNSFRGHYLNNGKYNVNIFS